MKDATFDPDYGDEAAAPLPRAQLSTLESLWSAARTELQCRERAWQDATGADFACFEASFGYDISGGQIKLYGPDSREYRDQDNRDYTHYTGDAIHADFPLALLALSERSFDRWCARLKRERLKAQARAEEEARAAAALAAQEREDAARAQRERAERTQLANLLAKYGSTGDGSQDQ